MQVSLILLETIIKLFLILLMGYGLVKAHILRGSDSKCVSAVLVYLVVPCSILNAFQIEYSPKVQSGLIFAILVSVLVHVLFIALTAVFARLFRLDVIEQLTVIYTNAGILVIPVVTELLGADYVIYSCGFVAVQLVLLWTHCKQRLSSEEKIEWLKILLNINILSIAAGGILFVLHIILPPVIGDTVRMMGNMVGPMGMLLAGMLIAEAPFSEVFLRAKGYLVVFLRLIFLPVLLVVVFALLGLSGLIPDGHNVLMTVYLACITPACATLTSMAQIYGADAAHASRLYVLTTVCSIVTMPLMIGLYSALIP